MAAAAGVLEEDPDGLVDDRFGIDSETSGDSEALIDVVVGSRPDEVERGGDGPATEGSSHSGQDVERLGRRPARTDNSRGGPVDHVPCRDPVM